MSKKIKSVKHRPVINTSTKKDISKEPAMIRLKELFNSEMSKEQQARTLEYLNTKGDLHNG